jgi:hypothetical protein
MGVELPGETLMGMYHRFERFSNGNPPSEPESTATATWQEQYADAKEEVAHDP